MLAHATVEQDQLVDHHRALNLRQEFRKCRLADRRYQKVPQTLSHNHRVWRLEPRLERQRLVRVPAITSNLSELSPEIMLWWRVRFVLTPSPASCGTPPMCWTACESGTPGISGSRYPPASPATPKRSSRRLDPRSPSTCIKIDPK